MAKEKSIPVTEDLTGFLLIEDTPGREIRGWHLGGPGVLMRITTNVKNELGEIISREIKYEFKYGAFLEPVCVNNDTLRANMAGGE